MQRSTIEVSSVRIKLPGARERTGILAYVLVEINGCIVIRDIKLVRRKDGRCIMCWPSKVDRLGNERCVAFTLNRTAHDVVRDAVLWAYREAQGRGEGPAFTRVAIRARHEELADADRA